MPLTAITKFGERVFAPELFDKRQDFFCRFCNAPMSFVDATLKIKHFRHLVKASCDYEGETEEHENCKYSIYKKLKAIGNGNVTKKCHCLCRTKNGLQKKPFGIYCKVYTERRVT